jgi:hypothetical protein
MKHWTPAVGDGWDNIRAYITCVLENGEAHQFECREKNRVITETGDPDAEPDKGPDTCPCEGCSNTRNAWAAISWIDDRMDQRILAREKKRRETLPR